jgi:RNA polymerase sigma-70 factor, ECF subfamily
MLLLETTARHTGGSECSEFARASCSDRNYPAAPRAASLCEDAILVERLRRGDEKAFEQMMRTFGARLLATARRYLGSEADASDALQDAFLCAFKSIHTFKGDSQLSTWLHRILVNSALMYLRAKRRRAETDDAEIDKLLPRFDTAGSWVDERICPLPVHVGFEMSELKAMVRRCIEQLPDAYRLVLILRDIDEFSTQEAGTLLDISTRNVRVRLHRARQALKVLIERERSL